MLGLECIGWRRGFALSASKEDGEGSDGEVPPADKPEVVNEIPSTLGLYRSLDHPHAARIDLTDKSRGAAVRHFASTRFVVVLCTGGLCSPSRITRKKSDDRCGTQPRWLRRVSRLRSSTLAPASRRHLYTRAAPQSTPAGAGADGDRTAR